MRGRRLCCGREQGVSTTWPERPTASTPAAAPLVGRGMFSLVLRPPHRPCLKDCIASHVHLFLKVFFAISEIVLGFFLSS